ncbi:hypothetical protein DFH06DRAFT_1128793 [Mycena polygramma]|nr:hypothetical protein DFH06DRAFT_1128793 [Mycena polygramma]
MNLGFLLSMLQTRGASVVDRGTGTLACKSTVVLDMSDFRSRHRYWYSFLQVDCGPGGCTASRAMVLKVDRLRRSHGEKISTEVTGIVDLHGIVVISGRSRELELEIAKKYIELEQRLHGEDLEGRQAEISYRVDIEGDQCRGSHCEKFGEFEATKAMGISVIAAFKGRE